MKVDIHEGHAKMMSTNIESIETWQVNSDVQVEAARTGIIGDLFSGCFELIKSLATRLRLLDPPREHYDEFESSLAALFFWGEAFDASRGELDHTLQDSEDLRDMTLNMLIAIGELIIQGTPELVYIITRESSADHCILQDYLWYFQRRKTKQKY